MTTRIPNRRLPKTFRARLDFLMDEHSRLRAAGKVVRGTSRLVEATPEHAEVERLRALLDEVLGHFTQKGHPGEPCVRTGWIRERTLAGWHAAVGGQAAAVVSLRDRDGSVWTPDGDGTYSAHDGTLSGWRRKDIEAQYGPVIEVVEPVSGSDGAR